MRISRRAAWTVTSAAAVALAAPLLLTAVLDADRGVGRRAAPPSPALLTGVAEGLTDAPENLSAFPEGMSDVPEGLSPALWPAEVARPAPVPPVRSTAVRKARIDPEDVRAGLLSTKVTTTGGGRFAVVPGRERAPGRGRVVRVRVEIERGLPIDPQTFARFVLRTLNDPKGWGAGGRMTFARTAGTDQDVRVVLASPTTSARLCRPLVTRGAASCGLDGRAVLTMLRWVRTTPEFAKIKTTYRQYLVNHEVGHLLGHGHERCPRRGALAPLMQQQTYGLKGCRPNAWAHP